MSEGEPAEHDRSDDRVFVFHNDRMRYHLMSPAAQDVLDEMRDEPCGTYECPAAYAGFEPGGGDSSTGVANTYDTIVQHRLTYGDVSRLDDEDILKEADARAAWLDAIAACRHLADLREAADETAEIRFMPQHVAEPRKTARTGESIAAGLGWLGDHESVEPAEIPAVFE
jgi:hypothetical protein